MFLRILLLATVVLGATALGCSTQSSSTSGNGVGTPVATVAPPSSTAAKADGATGTANQSTAVTPVPTVALLTPVPTAKAAPAPTAASQAPAPAGLSPVGSWRIYSERLYYDIGGGGSLGVPVSRRLELQQDGVWKFGDSKGKWRTAGIAEADWKRWGVDPYGPKTRLILDDWNGTGADGPIEADSQTVNFVWVIYRVAPPAVSNSGTVWIKFGKS